MADKKPIVRGPSQFQDLQAGDFLVGNTPAANDNSTRYATTAYVDAAVSGGGGGISDAPSDGKYYARKDAAWAQVGTPEVVTVTANTTLSATHLNKIVEVTSAGPISITIPSGLGSNGDMITVVHSNISGNVNIVRGSGVTLYRYGANSGQTIPKVGMMTLYRTATSNVWIAT